MTQRSMYGKSNQALDETKVLINAHYLHSVELDNEDGAERYLVLFDAAAVADVTLGTTVPTYWLGVPASAFRDWYPARPIHFKKGIVYAFVTEPDGSTGPTANGHVAFGLS